MITTSLNINIVALDLAHKYNIEYGFILNFGLINYEGKIWLPLPQSIYISSLSII
jgi:hypothetical protein